MGIPQLYNRLLTPFLFIIQSFTVLGVAYFVLHLYSYDLRVPFNYSGDAVVILMYIKSLIQDGWPTVISQLSAPFTYSGAAFPMLTSVDWLVIKLLSVLTTEPGYLLNGFWLLTLVFSAWTASYAGYQLGLSLALAWVSGVLYAFLPFALLRNVGHLNLIYYLVPLLSLLAVVIVAGKTGVRKIKQAIIIGLLACALQGFNYVYYSYFSVLLFGVATLISYKRRKGIKQFKLPLLAIAIISLSTIINMLPTLQSWHKNGSPPEMGYKYVAEVEIYGAKLRRMLMPHPNNKVFPLAYMAQQDERANFPNENENTSTRLGLYGAFGFLLIIVTQLRQGQGVAARQPMMAMSALGMATFLIITVGGFGALINLITVPDIRAYNRFSVFLSFFCIVAAGLWIQEKWDNQLLRGKIALCFIMGIFVLLSLYDQLLDVKQLVATQQNDVRKANEEKRVIERLEQIYPDSALILELPFTGFPALSLINKMQSYDHVRPYLWSHHLKWSWPSFSQRHRAWQTKMQALQGGDLIKAAIFSGFDAIWVDRFAYPDAGQALISSLSQGKVRQIDTGSSRFTVLDLREAATVLKARLSKVEFAEHTSALLGTGILVEWSDGFYGEEQNPAGHRFRWAQDQATIVLRNSDEAAASVCVAFALASPFEGSVNLEGTDIPEAIKTTAVPRSVKFPLHLQSGELRSLQLSTGLRPLSVPGDPRNLYFYVQDFVATPISPTHKCVNQ